MSEMSFTISHALHSIQYNQTLLKTCILINSRMYPEHLFTIPDMQVTMKPTTAIAAETQLLWMVESGFTQSRVAIMTKMGDILLSHKELLLILMILVKERKKYVSPAANSITWNQTREEGLLFGPVVAMGHEWIDIESVEYFVWVKSGDQHIDLTAAPTVHGTLFPNIDMDNVTDTLNDGLDHVKATMSSTLDTIESAIDHQHLLTPSALTFNWKLDSSSMSVAIYETAYFYYCDWCHHQFSGTKCCCVDNPTMDESTRPSTRRALSSGHVQADNPENTKPSTSHESISDTSNETVSSSELATPGTESSSELSDDSDV
ncbi:uncharacterized protein EDB91DRAFT_1246916 [Suillus paluster]|uniref:uncharacterized protein n=1 Tax=Suillus paluster TaxID=48578 RepID=UPI001B866A7F|nr:uncharacterized protein EDB91DRAFT_1246916 [Suillus paluster]KAG1744031.1 hypothetical protein EDB91DRAFT_1246916 [Suillus paluster]